MFKSNDTNNFGICFRIFCYFSFLNNLYVQCLSFEYIIVPCSELFKIENSISLRIFFLVLLSIMQIILKEQKQIFLLGDFNINLLNYNVHQPTNDFLDSLASSYIIPYIMQPTRLTNTNIYTNTNTNIFSNFFTSAAAKTKESIKYSHKYFSNFLKKRSDDSFFLSPTDKYEITNIISSLDPNKSTGPNGTPTKIIKLLKNDISTQLSDIFNVSF